MITTAVRAAARAIYATVLMGLLTAIPAGLIVFIGWPLPDHVPSGEELYQFATSGMSDQTVVDGAAILLWPVWAAFTVAVIVEAAAKIRGVQAPRIGALAPVQWLAAVLVAGITAGALAATTTGPLAMALGPAPAVAATSGHDQQPPRFLAAAAVSHHDTVTGQTVALTRTAGAITLVVDDCGYTYPVAKNDSLWRIAKECLGDPQRWPEIWKLNQDKYWPHISGDTRFRDPDLIFPGWELTLPAGATVPDGAEPINPPATPPPIQTPEPPASPATTTSPATTPPSTPPTTSATDGSDGIYMPPPSAVTTPSAASTPAATPTPASSSAASSSASASPQVAAPSQEQPPEAGPMTGVDLPGGWIPYGLGAGLLAAVAMAWRRRRHRYRPTPITTPHLDDPDLLPPLAAMTRIRQTLRRSAPQILDPTPAPAPTVREYASADIKPVLPPVGPSGADLAGTGVLPLGTGLGLTGPAALDAARGLLVAVLTSGSDDDPDAKGRAIIPASTLATLLGVSAVELGPITRLTVTDTLADAVTILEEELIRRARLAADAQAPTVQALRDSNIHAEPMPQLLLIGELDDPAWHSRLATAVRLGHSVDIGAALIGQWPSGTTLHIAADGTTGNDGHPRLAVLDTAITIEMLRLLREAHGDTEPAKPGTTPAGPQQKHAEPPIPHEPAAALVGDTVSTVAAAAAEPGAASPVTVHVLGRPVILGPGGEPMMAGLRAKALEILVYLALHRRGAPIPTIIEMLYPDATMRRASDRLFNDVGNLRRTIRQAAADNSTGTATPRIEPVINTGGHYHLNPQIVAVDWWTLTDHYAHAAHATDSQQRLAHLTTALAASHGPLAQAAEYDWIDTDREAVRRQQIKLHAHAASLHAPDDPHQAWLLLEQACELDPLSEDLACQAMRAAAATGDADAIRHRLKMLHDALDDTGIEPDGNAETLAKDLLHQLRQPRTTE